MKTTIYYRDGDRTRKINFSMTDKFNKFAIRKEAKKVIKQRWPELSSRVVKITWEYGD